MTTRWRAELLVVVAAAILPYLDALGGTFVSDAAPMIRDNQALLHSREWLAWFGRDYYWGSALQDVTLYRPLTVLSFLAHARTTGATPLPFLLGNVVLHAAVSVLVFLVGRRLVGPLAGLVGALLFAVHPIHTEAVAWIMGRAELLAALFALGACLACLRATDSGERRPWTCVAIAVTSFFAALCSKEHVGLLPAWFALVPVVDRRRVARPAVLVVAGSLAALGVFLALRAHALTRTPEMVLDQALFNPASTVAWPFRWLTALGVVARYALLLCWPAGLSHDRSFAEIPASGGIGWIEAAGIVVVLAVASVLVASARRSPGAALCLCLAPITFLLVSNLPFAIGTVMAERLVYLPSAGLALATGWLLTLPLSRAPRGTPPAVVVAGVAAVLVALGARTALRNLEWKDDYTLYSAALRASPRSAHVHIILSEHEASRGNLARAVELAQEALRIYPDSYDGRIALAKALVARGDYAAAAEEIRKALPRAPRDDRIRAQLHNNLGVVLAQGGHPAQAEVEYREAIRLAADDLAPRIALIELLRVSGRADQALGELREAARLQPARPALLYPLAGAALALGERQLAAALAQRASDAGVTVPEEFWGALRARP